MKLSKLINEDEGEFLDDIGLLINNHDGCLKFLSEDGESYYNFLESKDDIKLFRSIIKKIEVAQRLIKKEKIKMKVQKLSELQELSLYVPLEFITDLLNESLEDLPVFIKGSVDTTIFPLEEIKLEERNIKVRSLTGISYLHHPEKQVIELDFSTDCYSLAICIASEDEFKRLIINATEGNN